VGVTAFVLNAVTTVASVVAVAEICSLFKEASGTLALNQIGLAGNGDAGTIEQVNPCWVQAKFDRSSIQEAGFRFHRGFHEAEKNLT